MEQVQPQIQKNALSVIILDANSVMEFHLIVPSVKMDIIMPLHAQNVWIYVNVAQTPIHVIRLQVVIIF